MSREGSERWEGPVGGRVNVGAVVERANATRMAAMLPMKGGTPAILAGLGQYMRSMWLQVTQKGV